MTPDMNADPRTRYFSKEERFAYKQAIKADARRVLATKKTHELLAAFVASGDETTPAVYEAAFKRWFPVILRCNEYADSVGKDKPAEDQE